jgi:predicted Zn-dependent peptidase
VASVKRDELQRAWRRAFQPRSTTIAVAGDVAAADLRTQLDARFGGWRATEGPKGASPAPRSALEAAPNGGPRRDPKVTTQAPPAAKPGVRVVLVDVPGAAQSQVLLAQQGVPFGSPDRIPLGVMNAILGGMFSSRVNLDLREAHAYTYGARSHFSMRHGAGPFAAGGAIFTAHTADAVRALIAQIARIREEPVTAEELSDAKENAKLALPARFEGVDEVAGALQDLAVYDLPLDEYAVRTARIDAVTVDDVEGVAKKWLHPDAACVVVTGDRSKVEKDLSSVGPIELRDAYGDPVK